MVTKFRNERKTNPNRDRKSPTSVQDGSEHSFHNNQVVVKDWVGRLKTGGGSQQLNEVLDAATGMLAPKPQNRPYMWEVQTDLYETLKPYDESIPDLAGDLCVQSPFRNGPMIIYSRKKLYDPRPEIQDNTESPFHRAAKKNNRARAIRLWELGWSLSQQDPNGETPLDIMKRSDNAKLRELEKDIIQMLEAARTGNIGEIRKLFSSGLSPLMVSVDGRSALYEAITSFRIDMIGCLLESKAKEQLMLWDKPTLKLPLHMAAGIGFTKALERILNYYPDLNISTDRFSTALYLAAEGGHSDTVKYLLESKAQVVPSYLWDSTLADTPVHAALRRGNDKACEIVKLLLEADDGHKCLEYRNGWSNTPIFEAAETGEARCFDILLQHGATVHEIRGDTRSLLHVIVERGRYDILELCIEKFSVEELESGLKRAQDVGLGHEKVARLLKSYIRQARGSGGGKSGLLKSLRNGLENLKTL